MKTTRYFREQVLRKRPYLEERWILSTLEDPEAVRVQGNDRIQFWRYIPALGRHLRVVTLADGVMPSRIAGSEGQSDEAPL